MSDLELMHFQFKGLFNECDLDVIFLVYITSEWSLLIFETTMFLEDIIWQLFL